MSYRLALTPAQRAEQEAIRDHHPKPCIQERAAAILKVAAEQAIRQVAAQPPV